MLAPTWGIHCLVRDSLTGTACEERKPIQCIPTLAGDLRAADTGRLGGPAGRRPCGCSDSRSQTAGLRERSRSSSAEPVSRRAGLELPGSPGAVSRSLRPDEVHPPGYRGPELSFTGTGISHGVRVLR